MIFVSASCVLLLLFTTTIHYEALRLLAYALPQIAMPGRAKLVLVILGTFVAHALEMFLYALTFWLLAHWFGAGNLGAGGGTTLAACLYFSAETFTSLGYGDIVPAGALRLLAGMEALNGLLLIGWSASYTYLSMERLWLDPGSQPAEKSPGGP
jgi:hypothetical protein